MCDDESTASATRVGFVHMQEAVKEEDEPEILMDCGSTISLFRDKRFLKGLREARRNLKMNTNAGSKWISQVGNVPGYGPVYYDGEAISNLFSMSEVINRGCRVSFDSNIENTIMVHLRGGEVIWFPANAKGLYVKEKEKEMDCRRAKVNHNIIP